MRVTAEYHRYAAMTRLLQALVAEAGELTTLESLATTAGGRDVWLLRIAARADPPPDQRQALLVVGGIAAEHPASSEAALRVADRLLRAPIEQPDGPIVQMLEKRTIYIVPRANPDGIETFFDELKRGGRVNARPVDDDRDGVVDEDGPDDLNGDGLVTVMRARDPHGEWMIDPDEPRLMKKADRSRGERGVYALILEGIDDDADGLVNEDGPGGVDDDRNWPHFYEPGVAEAGRHQLSEPETRALAGFVVAHPQIAAALVYGRHDNLVNVPKGKQRGPTGLDYRDLHPDEVKLYEHVSEQYKRITGLRGSPGCRPEGALYAWLYSHRGIPTFATNLWWPIDRKEPDAATQPASQPATQATTQPVSQPAHRAVRDKPRAEREGEAPAEPAAERPAQKKKAVSAEAADPLAARVASTTTGSTGILPVSMGSTGILPVSMGSTGILPVDTLKRWLKYSDDQRNGEGFVEWTAYDHPTLGQVEIGGLAPYFSNTPPADELDAIAECQVRFLLQLSDWLPALRFASPEVKDVGGGVWQVEVRLVNDGYLPTHAGIARHAQLPPIIVRPLIERDRVLGGKPLERVENLSGSGGAASLRWLVRGKPGETVEFRATQQTYGELRTAVVLQETGPAGEATRAEENE